MKKRIHIFLAEDNPGDVELVREALREHHLDYHLFLASDGAQVRQYLERLGTAPDLPCPDILLLDLNLPQAHGFELFQMFRAHPLCGNTPVVIVTSSSAPKDRERAAALGAARYFCKPSELDEFLQLGSMIRELTSGLGTLGQDIPAGAL